MKKILLLPMLLLLVFSCEEILLEDDITDETVNLVAPVDDAEFYSTGITFTWDPIANGTQYRIQIARPNFTAPLQIITDNVVDTTSFTTQLNVGDYEWRIKAVNSGYQTAYSTRAFKVLSNEDFQNNSVTLSLPANNTITNVPSQNLVWQPVIGATGYHIQIVNTQSNTSVSEQDTNGTTFTYLFPEGSYQWKVRAGNGDQNTLYASRTILVDITAPNTPQLAIPANLNNTSNNDVTFQWNRVTIAGSVEKDSIYIYNNNTLTDLEYKNEQTSPYNTPTLGDGTYFWFVKAFDAAGNVSQQSSVFSFTLN